MNMNVIIAALVAFSMTIFCIRLLRPIATKIGLVDTPGGRKKHLGKVPLTGGIAMFVGFTFGCLLLPMSLSAYRSFFAAAGLLVLLGVMDDFHELSPRLRLFAQFFAAALVVFLGGAVLEHLGNFLFFRPIYLHQFGWIVSIFAIVVMINAVNMLDGADGFAGGISFIQLSLLFALACIHHCAIDTHFLLLFLAVIFAFLIFNVPNSKQGKVFMGDAGSTLLGLVVAWFCIRLSQSPSIATTPVTFLWIIALPLFEVITTVIRRIKKRQSPFEPDREHLHHVLFAANYSPRQALIIVLTLSLGLGVTGILLNLFHVSSGYSFVLFLTCFIIYLYCIMHAWKTKKYLKVGKQSLKHLLGLKK